MWLVVSKKKYEVTRQLLKEVIKSQGERIIELKTERSHLLTEIKRLRDRLGTQLDIDDPPRLKELCYV